MATISLANSGLSRLQPLASPWRKALPLDFAFPGTVFGPVLRLALVRLASICWFDAISRTRAFGPLKRRSKAPNHQGFGPKKSKNLAAESTGIPVQTERY
ncbi:MULTISPECIES: hypothetical protein [unclassified Bradyrhizobium]|uniref:hypothetical protein n=1 Tax=unclassified Bradyrhizobium TaxID=2631580 RepID=UPI0012F514AD|nr:MULTISPECIES: hypothetical protein [unclassified Bradyrhizobium]MCK1535363.1 hypothetical protein [Bradyrhizobium sp. 176]MCK1559324.1 hypothetical protein [Bradyrhizobium sp. 171]